MISFVKIESEVKIDIRNVSSSIAACLHGKPILRLYTNAHKICVGLDNDSEVHAHIRAAGTIVCPGEIVLDRFDQQVQRIQVR